jgi:hypothetical protein
MTYVPSIFLLNRLGSSGDRFLAGYIQMHCPRKFSGLQILHSELSFVDRTAAEKDVLRFVGEESCC